MAAHVRPSQNPVITTMQVAMQALFGGLVLFVVIRAFLVSSHPTGWIVALSAALCVVYVAVLLSHSLSDPRRRIRIRSIGVALLAILSLLLVWMTLDAAYLLFPLSFLFLEQLPLGVGLVSVCLFAVVEVSLIGIHHGWTVGGVLGPLAAAVVAMIVGLTVSAWRQQAARSERLYHDLLAVQEQLARSEREAGVLAERARLAREIHDTVAQALSSISLLLSAAERTDPDGPALGEIRLARETASASLAETRSFIRELTPPLLDEQTFPGALRRLADTQWQGHGLSIEIRADDALRVPMAAQTAMLRVAQGAMANVIAHAHATRASIEVTRGADDVTLCIGDDGVGISPEVLESASGRAITPGSFGLHAIRDRVAQLGGTTTIDSGPGRGTRVIVRLPVGTS